ncbi:DNA repair protein RadC [Prolixibacter sp. NT017]|uniref:RadC family protein n=1 Tax=Prolixibacter sp. NT017 TaxID=2652390 RepID=UPI001281D237|nr:DNA repair protein RadC [Prolixibacter sp. NT017]GET26944.1 DNA repair protein RadC [Prolixibacter sp. NT017]
MEEYRKLSIKDWAVEDRPREKLLYRGLASLSDAELIAILIGSGNSEETAVELSRRILGTVKNNLNALGKLDVEALKKFKGIGEAKAITVIAALELGRRRNQSEALKAKQVTSSRDAAEFLQPVMGDLSHEEFWLILLNRHNKIIHYERISQGGLTGTVIDVRLILKKALEKLATSIIIAHNHPSGNLLASESDRKITKQMKEAAKLMEIPLLDHLIITQNGYYSFADDGAI